MTAEWRAAQHGDHRYPRGTRSSPATPAWILIPCLLSLIGCESEYERIHRLERDAAMARTAQWRAEQRLDSLEGEVRAIEFERRCADEADAGACWMSLLWTEVDVSDHCREDPNPTLCARYSQVAAEVTAARARREQAERDLATARQ